MPELRFFLDDSLDRYEEIDRLLTGRLTRSASAALDRVNVPFRIAKRYLWARKSQRLIHLVSGISVVVVAAVCAAMIAILSAFNGIEELVEERLSLDTESAVLPAEGRVLDVAWVDTLAAHPGVAWAGGVLEQDVVVRRQGEPSSAHCSVSMWTTRSGPASRAGPRGDVLRPTPSERTADMSGSVWPASCGSPSEAMPRRP